LQTGVFEPGHRKKSDLRRGRQVALSIAANLRAWPNDKAQIKRRQGAHLRVAEQRVGNPHFQKVLHTASLKGLDRIRGQSLTADSPVATGHLLNADPGYATHSFTFDLDHRVGYSFDHLRFFLFAEDTFDYLDINK
jgi:hypothetical protein